MNAQHLANTFLHEADDLLGQIEEAILELDEQPPTSEVINQLFRAFHTIKGSGAMFGFQAVADFTHHLETVLDLVREGSVPFSKELGELILASTDQIKALFDSTKGGPAVSVESSQTLIDSLNALADIDAPAPPDAAPTAEPSAGAASAALQRFQIKFRPHRGIMAGGADPGSLLNELQALGQCEITADLDAIPPLEEIQPDQCYLGWEISLSTALGINAIKDIFIFVEDDCTLAIECLSPPASLPPPSPEPAKVRPPDAPAAAKLPAASPPKEPAAGARKNAPKDSLVRVPSEKLDHLVGLVGELVMNQSRLNRVAAAHDIPELTAPVEEIERLVSELRDNILGIRMMPIGTAFSRLKRLVHDLSTELGKEIDLVTDGAETELDKTVLDQLGDPLVHILRFIAEAKEVDHLTQMEAESQILHVHHGELGGLIAQHWQLPPRIVRGIIYHHNPEEGSDVVCDFACLANHLATQIEADLDGRSVECVLAPDVAQRLGIDDGGLARLRPAAAARFLEVSQCYNTL